MPTIPIIDISSLYSARSQFSQPEFTAYQKQAGRNIVAALQEYGFVGITGHGLPASLIAKMRELTIALFALPIEEKMVLQVSESNYRGYIPLGFFTPNAEKDKADGYEGYKLHYETSQHEKVISECDLYGPNIWPKQLPELAPTVARYWAHCDRITLSLMAVLCAHIKVPLVTIERGFESPLTNMTLLHYPQSSPNDGSGSGDDTPEYGIHPHKDTDALTILAPDKVGGLFLRPKGSEEWIEALVPEGCLVVNVGDMLETWSNGEFVSTPHMVVNRTGKERYSFPYFSVPRHDIEITPLTLSRVKDRAVEMPSLGTAGEISRKIWYSNWPDAKPVESKLNPYSHQGMGEHRCMRIKVGEILF